MGERWRALSEAERARRAGVVVPDIDNAVPRVNPYITFCKP